MGLIFFACLLISGLIAEYYAQKAKENNSQMELTDVLLAVQNEQIQFSTMRPPGSRSATLERRVVVTAPPELVRLTSIGEVQVLDKLVELLNKPDRAWAAEVLLAAMTRRDEKIVDSFATVPDQWWNNFGDTAQQRWSSWLNDARDRLVWNPDEKVFVDR